MSGSRTAAGLTVADTAPGLLVALLGEIGANGEQVEVRGHRVLELRNHVSVLKRPEHRVYLMPGRRGSIVATIAETAWVLAGRNDVGFLSRYLERATESSDDGLTWRAGYGPRLRSWGGRDQLREVLSTLQDDCASRRAVAVLFDPDRDFVASKDIPVHDKPAIPSQRGPAAHDGVHAVERCYLGPFWDQHV